MDTADTLSCTYTLFNEALAIDVTLSDNGLEVDFSGFSDYSLTSIEEFDDLIKVLTCAKKAAQDLLAIKKINPSPPTTLQTTD